MKPHYDLQWLIQAFESGTALEFVYFWGHSSKHPGVVDKSCFSQWFASPFTVGNATFKTAEHWMMAQKALLFNDPILFEKIVHCENPKTAKALGREVARFDFQTWCENMSQIVRLGNLHKFNQNPPLAEFLLQTKDKILVEASPTDKIWGIGLAQDDPKIDNPYAWPGQNLLGFALMEVRAFLRSFGHFKPLESTLSPPWIVHPGIEPSDLFWRMGRGESYLTCFDKYYYGLSERDRVIYQLTNPAPKDWKNYHQQIL